MGLALAAGFIFHLFKQVTASNAALALSQTANGASLSGGAEVITGDVVSHQIVMMNTISGATMSSKTTLKAIENALSKGRNREMKTLVAYQSKYGFTEIYARWIAEELGADLRVTSQITAADLAQYGTIVLGGGLYAGGVNGISLLTKNFERMQNKSLYLFTVGVTDVTDSVTTEGIRSALNRVLTPAMQQAIKVYHLRGGISYSRMSFLHRTMMRMFVKAVRKKPESTLCSEEKIMLESYAKDIDFTNREAIAPLVSEIKRDMTTQAAASQSPL